METKKLTCRDLMIGDWVLCLESTHKNKVYAQIDAIEEGQRSILLRKGNTNWFLYIDFIEPIPLTAEILEKNGIQCYNEHCEYDLKTNEYTLWVILDEDAKCVHIDKYTKGIPTTYHSEINFVHEFQHALRLCGVDKEIVL